MVARIKSARNLRPWVAWFLQERRRARLAGGNGVSQLPALTHHPSAGVPGVPLLDEIYLGENSGAAITDVVELWVLDPNVVTVEGDPPTEGEWGGGASSVSVTYNAGLGRWHYQGASVGLAKGDGDAIWIRGRFVRAGQPGPWGGVAEVIWSY